MGTGKKYNLIRIKRHRDTTLSRTRENSLEYLCHFALNNLAKKH